MRRYKKYRHWTDCSKHIFNIILIEKLEIRLTLSELFHLQMNNNIIDELIERIEQLQLSLRQTQADLNQVRSELDNNQREERARRVERETDERDGLNIGDRVRILNRVQLRNSSRGQTNIEGIIVRFTNVYVIISVHIGQTREGVDRYQEVRRAKHNVRKLQ